MPRCVFLSHPQPRDSGDYLHRVTLPARALARHWQVDDVQTTHPSFIQHAMSADLLLVQMVADPVIAQLMEQRRLRGLPTVYEISDDFRHFPASLPGHGFYARAEVQALIEKLAGMADLLQFSSHGLRTAYGHLNPRTLLAPNHLERVDVLVPQPGVPGRPLVLGWAGSAGHLDDARQLARMLSGWVRSRRSAGPRRPFVIRIMASAPIVAVFRAAGLKVQAKGPGSFEQYLRFLGGLDIGFAVIADDPFSQGRSDGKFIEMASRGTVCVASQCGEYAHTVDHGRTGFLFGCQHELWAVLDALMAQPERLQQVRQAANAYVAQHRVHELASPSRHEAYAQLLPGGLASPSPAQMPTEVGLRCLVEPSELNVLEASLRQMHGRLTQALSDYMALMQQEPDFYLPWQRAAGIAAQMGAASDADLLDALARSKLAAALSAGQRLGR